MSMYTAMPTAPVRYVRTCPIDELHSGTSARSLLAFDGACIRIRTSTSQEGVVAFPALSLRVQRLTADGIELPCFVTDETCN